MVVPIERSPTWNATLTATPLVVVNEASTVRQSIELRQEGRVVCSRPAVQDNHAGPLTLVTNEQLDPSQGDPLSE